MDAAETQRKTEDRAGDRAAGADTAAPPIRVGLAVIVGSQGVLISKRHDDTVLGGLWEFPGGKIEPGESPAQCVAREAWEEVGLRVQPIDRVRVVQHDYSHGRVELHAWWCTLQEGGPTQPEARAVADVRWARADELAAYAFPPANAGLLEAVMKRMRRDTGATAERDSS